MADRRLTAVFRHEAELDLDFPDEIAASPGGDALFNCIQCGTCSGTCPLGMYMDHSPRKIIAMTRAGFKDEVLRSFTIWQCSSCYACTVECPRQIKICELMSVLKQHSIQEGVYPRRFPAQVMAQEFYDAIRKSGRINELQVIARLYLKTNPLTLLRQPKLGWGLLKTGRLDVTTESIKDKQGLADLLRAAEETAGAA